MKNVKVLGLALVASMLAAPAFAGEAFVRNDYVKTNSVTKTNLNLDSHTNSQRDERYDSYAAKVSYGSAANGGSSEHDIDYSDVSVHTSGSNLWGKFSETNNTRLSGSINTKEKTSGFSHETSGGVR